MKCNKCDISMKCTESREENNIRYRRYRCPKCGENKYTQEKEIDEEYVKRKLLFLGYKYRKED